MRNADDSIYVFQRADHEFVRENASSVIEAKETMVRENGPNAHEMRMKEALMTHRGQTGVGVD
jgi:exopolysaccharide biosynthesis predicted pyruvyltransferase EpsI